MNIWTGDEVKEERRRDREERHKYMEEWNRKEEEKGAGSKSANEEVERDDESHAEDHRYPFPRGTRAGKWKTDDYTYNRWTPKYVVATDWTSHWKYKKWKKQKTEPSWETGKTGSQWEEATRNE